MIKVKLTKRARIWHEAGEAVMVSPAEADFLLSVHAAEEVKTEKKPKKTTEKE